MRECGSICDNLKTNYFVHSTPKKGIKVIHKMNTLESLHPRGNGKSLVCSVVNASFIIFSMTSEKLKRECRTSNWTTIV